jgi:hypothetical protein
MKRVNLTGRRIPGAARKPKDAGLPNDILN